VEASQAQVGEAQSNGEGQAAEQQAANKGLDVSAALGIQQPAQESGGEDPYAIAREIAQQALTEFQQNLPAQQQVETQQQDPDLDLSFLDPAEPGFDADQVMQHFQQVAQEVAQRENKELREGLENLRMENEAAILLGEHPEMADPQIYQDVVKAAQVYAQRLGTPELGNKPQFWGHVYKLAKAEQARQEEEASNAPRAAHLEGGGGAAPSGSQVDLGDLIVGAPQGGSSVLPFQ
jgi:hypothetical protein